MKDEGDFIIASFWAFESDLEIYFDEILRRLNGEVREEIWMKPEPSLVCDENFLKNSVDYAENEEGEEEEERLIMLKQKFTDLVDELERQIGREENKGELILNLRGHRAEVEEKLEKRQQERRAASELAGVAPKGRGGRRPVKKKKIAGDEGSTVATPLPAMFAAFGRGGETPPTAKVVEEKGGESKGELPALFAGLMDGR